MTMRIIITQAEIEEAIKTHVLKQITIANNQNVSVDFKNTRGEDGATAEINISAKPTTPAEPTKRTPVVSAREAVQASIIREEPEQVEEPVEANLEPAVTVSVAEEDMTAKIVPVTTATTAEAVVDTEETTSLPGIKQTPESIQVDEPDEPTKPSGSLFATLKRPQN